MARRRLARWLGLGLAVALTVVVPGAARTPKTAPALTPCASMPDVLCGYVSVPLDYTHPEGRHLRLFVTAQPKTDTPRGTILLLAGGPGEASTTVFDLTSDLWRSLFPGYLVAAYDDRGTGDSTSLSCRVGATAEQCGTAIGPRRVFYGTRENVEDMDAVRRALGVERFALFGLSYGTKQALAYALAHPGNVERLLLDSVEPVDGPEPLGLDTLRAITAALKSICHSEGCAGVSPNPGADFARLANALAARPIEATVPVYRTGWAPRKQHVHIDGRSLLDLAIASDLNSGLAVALPAAVKAALEGRPRLLEHLAGLVGEQSSEQVNSAVLYATTCNDGPFPWHRQTPVRRRRVMLANAVAALKPPSLRGFGSWAAQGTAAECLAWPAPAGQTAASTGKVPDVPVLVLAGDRDVRTPWREGVEVAAHFRQGRVLVAPGVGHMAVSSSPCVDHAVRAWINGRMPPARCPRVPLTIEPLAPLPPSVSLAAPIGTGGLAGRTLAATVRTLREAEASWLTNYPSGWVAGLEGGMLSGEDFDVFRYSAYSDVPGLAISGRLTFSTSKLGTLMPGSERGIVSVGGSRAANGFLQVRNHRIFGTLGGRHVSAPF